MEENQNPERRSDTPVQREEADSASATSEKQVSVHDVMRKLTLQKSNMATLGEKNPPTWKSAKTVNKEIHSDVTILPSSRT